MMSIRKPNSNFFAVIYLDHVHVRQQLGLRMGNTADVTNQKKTRCVQERTCRKEGIKKAAEKIVSRGTGFTSTPSDSGEV